MNGSSNRTANELSSEHRTLSIELRIIPLFQDDILAGLLPNILELNLLRHYHKIMRGVIDKLDRGVSRDNSSRVFGSLKGKLFRYLVKESKKILSGTSFSVVLYFRHRDKKNCIT